MLKFWKAKLFIQGKFSHKICESRKELLLNKQECISLGCLASAAVAVCQVGCLPGGCLPGGMSTWGVSIQGGVCLGVSAQGVGGVWSWGYLPRGCLPGGLPRMGVCPGSTGRVVCQTPPYPPRLDRMTEWQTGVKTLPCRNFVADGNKSVSQLTVGFQLSTCVVMKIWKSRFWQILRDLHNYLQTKQVTVRGIDYWQETRFHIKIHINKTFPENYFITWRQTRMEVSLETESVTWMLP